MTIWRNVNGKGVGIPAEELENLEKEEQDKLYAERANQQQDVPDLGETMDAIEYYDENKKYSDEELDQDVALANKSVEARKKADAEEGVNGMDAISYWDDNPSSTNTVPEKIVGSTGTYGTLKNENFSAYRAQRDAERKRNQEAIRAGRQAEADKRDELLATGRFFDDGRGNIKMKKEYRRQGMNGDRNTLRHFNKDTEHNTYADATNRMIKAAGQAAFNKSIDSWDDALQIQNAANSPMNKRIAANREEMKRMAEEQDAQEVRNAESNLGIFDGIVAAFDDMKNGGRIEDETVFGGKDEQGRDGRWKYDSQGRVIGQADPRKTGRKVRVGYLAKGQIIRLNNELEQFGGNMRISGITARQVFNPDFPDKEVSKPMLYVQGVRFDPESKKSVPFGEWMTMDKLYKMGLSNAQKAGGFYASTHSEDAIIDRLGDIFGVRKRKESDPKYRKSVAEAKLAEYKAENPNWLTFDERLQLQRESDAAKNERAKVSQEIRKETEEEKTKRHRDGQVRAWDNARYSAIYKRLDNMRRAKLRDSIGAESRQYTDEQIAAEEKRLLDLMDSDRAKAFPHLYENGSSRQANPSSDDNRSNESSESKPTREEAIKRLLATGKYKLEDGKVVPK